MHAIPDLSYWVLQTIAMLITAILLPKLKVSGPLGALGTVVALAFVNAQFWDAALFFQLPESFTLQAGLLLISNGILFWVLVKILPGIEIEGFVTAIIAPLVFTVTSIFLNHYGKEIDWETVYETTVEGVTTTRDFFQEKSPIEPREPGTL